MIPFPSDLLTHVKTSAAARKGFDLYAGRHGAAAAHQMSYGLLSSIGYYAAAAEVDTANAAHWMALANRMIRLGF
jgi:hypothetical protein